MDAARWSRVSALFDEALAHPPENRQAWLESACDDPDVRAEVLALLEEDAHTHPLLGRNVGQVADELFDRAGTYKNAVGPYRLTRVLGEGGMGVVYLAERDDLGSRAAVKILRDAALSPARRARFMLEEQILAGLKHPAIAHLYDADVLPDGTPYFVMEYVEGVSITEYCQTHRSTLNEKLHLFRQVCEAVAHAHRQAVIHRDLKPSNILVAEDDQGQPHVKLLDFGIAKPLDRIEDDRTAVGLRLMTPAYAAPEQLRGDAVGVYTDVYALGVLLYELLTDARPHDLTGLTPAQAEGVILNQPPAAPSTRAAREKSVARRAWHDLDVLCLTAMHRDPQRRYPSVDALVRDVNHFLEGEPLDARRDSLGYRTGKFIERHRALVGAALGVALVIVALTAFYTVRLAQARNVAVAEADKAEHVSQFLLSLFEAGDPFMPGNDSLTVEVLLNRGVERAAALDSQPLVQAQMLTMLGRVFLQLSQYDRADTLLRQALRQQQALDADPLDQAETLANLAGLYQHTSAYDSAEVFIRQSLRLREQYMDDSDPLLARTHNDLGVILCNKGAYEEALATYNTALDLQQRREGPPTVDLATTVNNMGACYYQQGDYERAEPLLRESLALSRAVHGREHGSVAIDLANLGVLMDTRGNYAAADSMLTEALRIKRLRLGNDHYETAFALTQLGGMLRRKGDYDRAEAYLREAMAIEARILDPEHRNRGVTAMQLGLALQGQKRYAEAETALQDAERILSGALGSGHPFVGVARANRAHLLHVRGRLGESESLFQSGLALLRASLPPGHDLTAIVESKYAALLATRGRYAEAESLLVHSFERLAETLGLEHDESDSTRLRLVRLYRLWEKPEQAARWQAQIRIERRD